MWKVPVRGIEKLKIILIRRFYTYISQIQHDMNDDEGALVSYKKSYELTKSRVVLNRGEFIKKH